MLRLCLACMRPGLYRKETPIKELKKGRFAERYFIMNPKTSKWVYMDYLDLSREE